MKTNLLQRNARNPFIWVVLLLTGISCQRNAEPQLSPAIPKQEVADLLSRAYQRGTPEEYAAITEAYKHLSFEELELFNQLKTEQDVIRIKQKVSSAGGRVSQTEMTQMSNELRRVGDFRTALNKRAVQLYGKPYNQLEEGLVDQLMNQMSTEEHYSFAFERPDASARVDQTNACSEASFLLVSTRVSDGRTGYASWTSRRTPGTTDCDYEYAFPGYFVYFDPKDWFAGQLCDSFNNRIARRYATSHTRLLFGNRGVWLWIGYPGLLSITMRY
jgi:hypothetical protein